MSEPENGRVTLERQGNVGIVTIDRPDKMNAYTFEMFHQLMDAFAEFNDNPDFRVAILTGAGERAFCAGADLSRTVTALTGGAPRHFPDMTKRFFSDIYKPIITAVNGICTAGGTEMLQGT